MGVVLGKMGEGGQKMQTLNFKVSQSWGCNIQHGDLMKVAKRADLKRFHHKKKKALVRMCSDGC